MNILPNADTAIIPIGKFTEYCLHPIRGKGKAYAFEHALGYALTNPERLIENIRNSLPCFDATCKGKTAFGIIYEVAMQLVGENGKTATVLTSWIIENDTESARLTSAYVKKRRTNK
jgi:hypothetical protein